MAARYPWARVAAVLVGIATLLVALIVVTGQVSDRKRLNIADDDSRRRDVERVRLDPDFEAKVQAFEELRHVQAIYIDSVKHRNDVLKQILSDPGPAWPELRDLSAEMKVAEEEQLSKLEAATWPQDAEGAIVELKTDIRLAIPYWQKAAVSSSSDEAHANIGLALKHCGSSSATKARVALHLLPG
ncbi:hypothetical protein [Krasilnikovia sp. MM14-A1004]|uniref:hypothetical protein n=1 Tax=Krasilnikovia sp. MM14-A1004 TaxID=3373541 RepID=UPI00399C67CE